MKTDELKEDKKVALVAILGVTPAVLTEAVWALAHPQEGEPVVPDEILVLTTGTGERVLKNTIGTHLARGGVWSSLKKDLAAEGLDTKGKLIVKVELFRDANGNLLEDLPTQEANLQAADKMMKEIRDYTDDDGWIVYGLLAGGRKTMSALFFSCMCLLGRRCDRIYHVLASEGYDARLDPPFCYPQKGMLHHEMECVAGKWRRKAKGKALPSENCKVNLFAVPFAYMGEWCQQKCRGKRLNYSSLIVAVQESMDAAMMPGLAIDFAHKSLLLIDEKPRKLSPAEMLVFVACLQTRDEENAKDRLYDLQFLLDPEEDGEEHVDEFSASWGWMKSLIQKQIFYRPNENDQKQRCAKDFTHNKSSLLKDKLPEIVSRRLVAGQMGVDDVEWRNLDCVKREVLEKIFFNGVPDGRS